MVIVGDLVYKERGMKQKTSASLGSRKREFIIIEQLLINVKSELTPYRWKRKRKKEKNEKADERSMGF
jgi:hypothetical protein